MWHYLQGPISPDEWLGLIIVVAVLLILFGIRYWRIKRHDH